MSVTSPETPSVAVPEEKSGGFFSRFVQGEFASLRVIIGLVVIWAIFYVQEDTFLTAGNLTNLALQVVAVGTISVGIVLVLLLGEIDLSVGAVSGLGAAIMAVLNVKSGVPAVPAIALGILAGTAIGLFQGSVSTFFGVPSFVVTLAGLLGWQGVLLLVLGETGTVNITNATIVDLTSTFFDPVVGWVIAAAAIAIFALMTLNGRRRRIAAELPVAPLASDVVRIVLVGIAVIAATAVLNADRGVPLAVLILVGFVVFFQYVTTRTRFGRHIYAVGGNEEAARRSGISVTKVKIVVFTICSTMAAVGGVMAASRLLAVNQASGAGDLLLLAIAGPVIAGTSLFGGRGSVWTALLGALVIGSISNGMDLLGLESDVKYMITGAVLLLAVLIDAVARRQRQQLGRV
jgi:D-xylose transport system permease protein